MALQIIEINSVKINFDKEKTLNHRTEFNQPCDCQDCRNFYNHVENNLELVKFLSDFGIDYNCAEEVFSWDLTDDKDSLIHHEGYYGVFGKIEGDEFSFEKYGVKITFAYGAPVPCNRTGDYFWLIIEGDFPYILVEKREPPITFLDEICKEGLFSKNNKNLKK